MNKINSRNKRFGENLLLICQLVRLIDYVRRENKALGSE